MVICVCSLKGGHHPVLTNPRLILWKWLTSYATHTPGDLGAHTYRLVGVKAVGRLQSVGVCATLRRRSALLRRLTPIQMLNLQSALHKGVYGDNFVPQASVRWRCRAYIFPVVKNVPVNVSAHAQ